MNKTFETGSTTQSTDRPMVATGGIAHVKSGSAEIGYGRFNDRGTPMLFIPGVATPGRFWAESASYYAKAGIQVFWMDNRGVDTSSKPDDDSYTVEQMAIDVRAVLDDLGWDTAHIWGASLGGQIAQTFARDNPERVRSLIIASSTAGVPGVTPQVRDLLGQLENASENEDPAEAAKAQFVYLYGEERLETHSHVLQAMIEFRKTTTELRLPPLVETFANWTSKDWLGDLAMRSLIVHGVEDAFFSFQNAIEMQKLMPKADMLALNAPHGFDIDADGIAHATIAAWIARTDAVMQRA